VTAPDSTHRHERILDLEARLPALRAGGIDAVVVGGPGRESADALTNTSQTLLAAIVNSSDDAIMAQSLEGIILSWNPAAEKMYGYTAEEVVGKSVSMLSPAGMADEMVGILGQIKAGERIEHHETSRRAKDGSIVQVSLTVSPVHDEAGHVVATSSTARDITGHLRVDAQAKLGQKRAAEYARSLIEASLDPLVTISPEGKITDVNEATVNVTGAPREALVGTDFSDYFTDPDQANAGYQQVFAQGSVTDYPLTVRHRDGRLTDVLYNASVYTDAAGHVLGVFAAARDITERKQAADYARSLIEASLDPLVTISPEGKITDVNEATVKVTGAPREALVGTDFFDYFTDQDQARAGYQQVFAQGSVTDYPLTVRHRDGRLTDVLYNASVYTDAAGHVLGVFAAARDITERKQAEEALARGLRELERRSEELARSNAELEVFAYVASHDLAEPIRAISGPVSLLARRYGGQLDERADEYIGFAVDGCRRMQALIEDLLQYSRVGRVEGRRERVDCNRVVATVLTGLSRTVAETETQITVDDLPVVSGEPSQLGQVFQNLISNALKFRAPGVTPRVYVRAERIGSEWRFSVTDNGIGIESRHQDRVFGMFKRLHPRDAYPGTGIGLAICKKIVENHGGRIGIDSAPGGGCRFWFALPGGDNGP